MKDYKKIIRSPTSDTMLHQSNSSPCYSLFYSDDSDHSSQGSQKSQLSETSFSIMKHTIPSTQANIYDEKENFDDLEGNTDSELKFVNDLLYSPTLEKESLQSLHTNQQKSILGLSNIWNSDNISNQKSKNNTKCSLSKSLNPNSKVFLPLSHTPELSTLNHKPKMEQTQNHTQIPPILKQNSVKNDEDINDINLQSQLQTNQIKQLLNFTNTINGLISRSTIRDLSMPQGKRKLFKTEICKTFIESRLCAYGTKCNFAHGMSELLPRERVPNFRTQLCEDPCIGLHQCSYGSRCNYVHPGEEIRRPCENTYYDVDYYKELKKEYPIEDFPFGVYV